MKIDLKSLNRKELEKLIADAGKALGRITSEEKKKALDAVKKAAAAHGFSLSEITGDAAPKKRGPKPKGTAKPRAKTVSVPKYRNPADAKQTWTGKGRQPQWFKDAMAAGKSPKSLEI